MNDPEPVDLLGRLQDELERARAGRSETDVWACPMCGQDADAHNTCPGCFHCPGYPHDYGCDGGQS